MVSDESNLQVEIVDFKTGQSGNDLDAQERLAHVQQQLHMYAIATQDALGLEPLRATAHFLYANQAHCKEDISLSVEEIEAMKRKISDTVGAIKRGAFPMCASTVRCVSCDFRTICAGSRRQP